LVASEDLLLCRQHIARHSKSFYLSSLLLPRPVRHQAWALYAFCRQADDAVDGDNPGDGTVPGLMLRRRRRSLWRWRDCASDWQRSTGVSRGKAKAMRSIERLRRW
jgi:phytoene/squalene synthetase